MDNIKEGKTVEELLKPRFKCIADFPACIYKVGEIINYYGANTNESDFTDWQERMNNYPHLFKKLEWWEDREEKDMPQFLKAISNYSGEYYYWPAQFIKEENGWTVVVDKTVIPHGNYLKDKFPATEKQYLEYLNQNK